MHGPSETYKRPARKSGARCWGETLLSPKCAAAFLFPFRPTPSGKDVADHEKTYVLIQAPYTVIYAVIFPYVWPPTKWQQSAHAPPMTGEGKHGILVV